MLGTLGSMLGGPVRAETLRGSRGHAVTSGGATALLLVDAARASVRHQQRWHHLERGDIMLLAPGATATVWVDGPGDLLVVLGAVAEPRATRVVSAATLRDEPRVAALRACLRAGAGDDLVTVHAATALVHALGGPATTDPLVRRALAMVLAQLDQRLTLTELACRLGTSRAALARRFQAALGTSPERYITRLRLEEAARRLLHTDAGLAQIAAAVGYQSEFAFSRAFKRLHGVAPGLFRRRGRAGGDAPRGVAPAAARAAA